MDEYEIIVIWGTIVFLLIFLINYFLILKREYKKILKNKNNKKGKKVEDFLGFSLIVSKFNLDVNKMKLNYVFVLSSLINAFIISIVFMIIYIIPWDLPYKMLLSFVLLFALIYALYELLGRHLVKKGWVKNGKQKN